MTENKTNERERSTFKNKQGDLIRHVSKQKYINALKDTYLLVTGQM